MAEIIGFHINMWGFMSSNDSNMLNWVVVNPEFEGASLTGRAEALFYRGSQFVYGQHVLAVRNCEETKISWNVPGVLFQHMIENKLELTARKPIEGQIIIDSNELQKAADIALTRMMYLTKD